ncbi:hypothetical protein BC628DRAFT_1422153 [Trametes gibbosa]|nr:hypothetical protein BC628DRAFT_1422152 [Trametes gibbosa]KAI0821988.1 hypothetical protein BC628DRAFT_1422153 [Trametes gibbosa]
MVSFKSFALLALFASLATAVSVGREVAQGRSNEAIMPGTDSTENCAPPMCK